MNLFYLFIYLFICGLFKDAASSLGFVTTVYEIKLNCFYLSSASVQIQVLVWLITV
jgi:hypothetical protein